MYRKRQLGSMTALRASAYVADVCLEQKLRYECAGSIFKIGAALFHFDYLMFMNVLLIIFLNFYYCTKTNSVCRYLNPYFNIFCRGTNPDMA